MVQAASEWRLQAERGPDWLIIRVESAGDGQAGSQSLCDAIWSLAQMHFTYRLVVEMHGVNVFSTPRGSQFATDFVALQERIHQYEGRLRLCGLSHADRTALNTSSQCDCLDVRDNRREAVLGHRPSQPR